MGKYLLIDDDDIIQFIHSKVVKRFDPEGEVVTAFSVDEGINVLQDMAPDALPDFIFVDISMPVKSGFNFIEELEGLDPSVHARLMAHTRVFILTSSVNPNDLKRSAQSNVVEGLLSKPLNPTVLEQLRKNAPAHISSH